jgi:hypothetical protein
MDPRLDYGVNVHGMKMLIWIPRQAKKKEFWGEYRLLNLIGNP